jgi:hypothetical protein
MAEFPNFGITVAMMKHMKKSMTSAGFEPVRLETVCAINFRTTEIYLHRNSSYETDCTDGHPGTIRNLVDERGHAATIRFNTEHTTHNTQSLYKQKPKAKQHITRYPGFTQV